MYTSDEQPILILVPQMYLFQRSDQLHISLPTTHKYIYTIFIFIQIKMLILGDLMFVSFNQSSILNITHQKREM